ncbi:MAG: hypothetical protein ACYTBZ_27525, partial [Planctomycetota bacterium]
MKNVKLKLFVVVFVVGWLGAFTSAQAQIITSVSRVGTGTNSPPIIAPNSLDEDELCFGDRKHQYNSIPIDLLGAEYVMVSNNDKTELDYALDVTLSQIARMYLFLDNRLGHDHSPGGDPNLNPNLYYSVAGMVWVYDMGFTDTGLNIGIDEGGDGQINQWMSVYVGKFQPGTIRLWHQNDVDPTNRNMYAVAAQKFRPFTAFWFDNRKLNLARTPYWVSTLSGYYAGPDWFDDDGYLYQPFDFEGSPPGGLNLWAFTDRLTFQYTDARVHPVHRWFFIWDPSGQGNCLELMFEDVGLVSPLDPNIMDNLVIQNHTFSVNAGKAQGVFSDLELIPINTLVDYGKRLGMTEADVRDFKGGEIFGHLKITDPCNQGYVGVQHASWNLWEPSIQLSTERLVITEGDVISYGVRLPVQPDGPVTVNVKYDDPATIKWADYDDGVYQLHFDRDNWAESQVINIAAKSLNDSWRSSSDPQVVNITAEHFANIWKEGKSARIAHYMDSDSTEAAVLPVTVWEKKTAELGYADTDSNRDAITNFKDFSFVAANWLLSTEAPQEVDIWDPGVMLSQDIGTTGGSASWTGDELVIEADGADIWST